MTKRPALILPAIIVGLLLLAIAALYWVSAADALPSFMPGHEAAPATTTSSTGSPRPSSAWEP
jgi:hypothetical protein